MSTLRNKQVQDTLDAIVNNPELRAILAEEGMVVKEDFDLDANSTIDSYMELCGYTKEEAINAYTNVKLYE